VIYVATVTIILYSSYFLAEFTNEGNAMNDERFYQEQKADRAIEAIEDALEQADFLEQQEGERFAEFCNEMKMGHGWDQYDSKLIWDNDKAEKAAREAA
jgi:biopolymer transport protein ExbB/TolQ